MPRGGAHLWKCLLCLLPFCCLKRIRCVSIWGYKCNARPRLCASVSSCQLFLAMIEETKLRQFSFDSNLILLFPPSNVSQVQREEAQRYFTDPADSPRPRLHWWVLCHMFVTHFSLETHMHMPSDAPASLRAHCNPPLNGRPRVFQVVHFKPETAHLEAGMTGVCETSLNLTWQFHVFATSFDTLRKKPLPCVSLFAEKLLVSGEAVTVWCSWLIFAIRGEKQQGERCDFHFMWEGGKKITAVKFKYLVISLKRKF